MNIDQETQDKLNKLNDILNELGSVAVAFSGGVDSSLLLKVAHQCLGKNALGIYCDSALMPSRERKVAYSLAKEIGVELLVLEGVDLTHEAFRMNPENRCYLCKGLIFDRILEAAARKNFRYVVDGSNVDDMKDYRPGKKALSERGVRSPLQEAGLTKSDIRAISKAYGLPTWDKDALACLATRIPYNSEITEDKLQLIDTVEDLLVAKGFRNVRARLFPGLIHLEVRDDQIGQLKESLAALQINKLIPENEPYRIEVNEQGYKQGRMNDSLV